ncbi:MAG: hypothetical protein ACSHWU_13180 [Marinicella sp.]
MSNRVYCFNIESLNMALMESGMADEEKEVEVKFLNKSHDLFHDYPVCSIPEEINETQDS